MSAAAGTMRSASLQPRWKARVRLEDQRQAAFRSAAEGLEELFVNALAALEESHVFEPLPDGGSGASTRCLSEAFVAALSDAVDKVRLVEVSEIADASDLTELVARQLANSEVSSYEQRRAAAMSWPRYALCCPARGLCARFRLAPSGLVTYSLGPSDAGDELDGGLWQISGEGCWRVLAADRGCLTEVVLEMRQGLEGTGPSKEGSPGTICNICEPPCILRIDLRDCIRVLDEGADLEDDEIEEWDEEGDEEGDAEGEEED
ncbi:unnamed protein product [Polarella glacialis]|uniref:Uncharacterized protein n=1 Tax=Polarella glacialis TaxID=89957 RepID=A0A813G685_POLGL|nr:unnamed protein product [Polarella glacialis]